MWRRPAHTPVVAAVVSQLLLGVVTAALAQQPTAHPLGATIDALAGRVEERVIAWRRDIHQHPELGNREFRTAQLVADHLRGLGMEVRTGVARTGVVGLLTGGRPGPVVAIRADMDALPVTEQVDLPFASRVTAMYAGREVGVMHACGHDLHTAILMGVAQVLAEMRRDLPGSVKFIFQPAEEGAPDGEEGGAELMIRQGTLDDPAPEAVFGLHVFPGEVGTIGYRPGPVLASSDGLQIVVHGRQTHGAQPWGGVDPIVVASQIVLGLQTIASRQLDVASNASIITIGSIHGGVRSNIIPDRVDMIGTIRTFDQDVREDIHRRVRNTAELIAQSAGARAEVSVSLGYPVTVNDARLTELMVPTMQRVAGPEKVSHIPPVTGSEDFSYYVQRVPGLFLTLGITPPGADMDTVAVNHSPFFFADEAALLVGVKLLSNLAVDYMLMKR